MAQMMQAALLHGIQDVRVAAVPRPVPQPEELLLAVRAVSLCGSDRHYYMEGGIGSADICKPVILGHEFAAVVAEQRGDCAGIEPGTLVAVDPARPCGRCEWCLAGHPNLCPHVRFAGSPPEEHGALAEYAVAVPECLFPLPADFGAERAALLEPLGVAVHALDLAHLRPMETVAVLGLGAIGLLMLQVARLAGAGEVYAVDPVPERAELAAALGATAVSGEPQVIRDLTGGRGVDLVLEATDSATAAAQACEAARIGGRVVLAGIPESDELVLHASTLRRKGLTLKMVRRMKHTYPRAIQMVQSGRVQLDPLITHAFPLEQAAAAFSCHAARHDGVIRALVMLPG
jgi:L-iditol 2-dehydrogenase